MIINSELARLAQTLLKDSSYSLVEANWQTLGPVPLSPGQQVQAEVMANLPNSLYLVRIANQMLQMELPLNLQPGQTVELTFVSRDPRLVFALSRSGSEGAPVSISDTGRWLNSLTQGADGRPSQASSLPRITTILTGPPNDTALLATLLRTAMKQSGMFYESHLSRWVRGEERLPDILREPQGSLSRLAAALGGKEAGAAQPTAAGTSAPAPAAAEGDSGTIRTSPGPTAPPTTEAEESHQLQTEAAALPRTTPEQAAKPAAPLVQHQAGTTPLPDAQEPGEPPGVAAGLDSQRPDARNSQASGAGPAGPQDSHPSQLVDPRTMPLIREQLALLLGGACTWTGQVWPDQELEWSIGERESGGNENEADAWQTGIRLVLPRLGAVNAVLRLTGRSVHVSIQAVEPGTTDLLRQAGSRLGSALEKSGIALQGLVVRDGEE